MNIKKEKQKINLFEVLELLEKYEKWVNSEPEINQSAVNAIRTIESFENKEVKLFDNFKELTFLIETSAHLRFDLFLRLFNEIGIKQDGFGGDTIVFCYDGIFEQDNEQVKKEMNVVLQRLILMIQAEVVNKIFGVENRTRVLNTINQILEENGEGEPYEEK